METLKIQAALQIARSGQEVFESIVDPRKMANYFIAEASGPMREGETVTWKFPEFEDPASVKVTRLIPGEKVAFEWEGPKAKTLEVVIELIEISRDKTLVKVTEGEMQADQAGIEWFGQNTEGWANFLACLKAYVEYGINLRKGSFDFMKA